MKTYLAAIAVLLVFLAPAFSEQYTILHNFPDPAVANDGENPMCTTVSDGSRLYGMTHLGGANGVGALFSMAPDGSSYTILHHFGDPSILPIVDGINPHGSLLLLNGAIYGTTNAAGAYGGGTVFSIAPDGTGYTILHNFSDPTILPVVDGARPQGTLIADGSKLYGTTELGGSSNYGTVFSLDAGGAGYAVLHEFTGGPADGQNPRGALLLDGATLYGTTTGGGAEFYGTVFSMAPDGSGFTIVRSFEGLASLRPDGIAPYGSLISDGSRLYGMTYLGGKYGFILPLYFAAYNCGTIFAMNPDGSDYTVLHDFGDRYVDGLGPLGDPILEGGILYGLASQSNNVGITGRGTLFSCKPDGTAYTTQHLFGRMNLPPPLPPLLPTTADGAMPMGSLMSDGSSLYGTAYAGGQNGYGVVFSMALPPPPMLDVTVSSHAPRGGDAFTVDVSVQPVAQAFDAWGVIIGEGLVYSFDPLDPNRLVPGAYPLVTGVPGLAGPYANRLYRTTITLPTWARTFDVVVGLVPAGQPALGTQDAIPGYADVERVTVTP